jgi:hypothetical protein
LATVVQVGVKASGTNDEVGGFDGAMLDILENAFEDATDFELAALEESGAMSVTVDGGAVGNLIGLGDPLRAAPANEVALDCVAIGMGADETAASVT